MVERRAFELGVVVAFAIAVAALVVAIRSGGAESVAVTNTPANTPGPVVAVNAVPEGAAEVVISGFAYNPEPVRVRAGEAVAWVNYDGGVPHTATAADGAWDSGVMELGDGYTRTFDEPGVYTYVCTLHPPILGAILGAPDGVKLVGGGGHGMEGTIVVE
ncbi:MAG: plastocyanin/azurin family copper-binding protein [Dehalococcoidia bacterium]